MQTGAQVADSAIQGILSRIDILAQKLGTTAAYLWQTYLAQARVESIRDGIIAFLGLVAVIASSICFPKAWKKVRESEYGDDALYVFYGIVCGIGVITGLITFLSFGYSAIGEALNPSYWAFQHLTLDLKNLL